MANLAKFVMLVYKHVISFPTQQTEQPQSPSRKSYGKRAACGSSWPRWRPSLPSSGPSSPRFAALAWPWTLKTGPPLPGGGGAGRAADAAGRSRGGRWGRGGDAGRCPGQPPGRGGEELAMMPWLPGLLCVQASVTAFSIFEWKWTQFALQCKGVDSLSITRPASVVKRQPSSSVSNL